MLVVQMLKDASEVRSDRDATRVVLSVRVVPIAPQRMDNDTTSTTDKPPKGARILKKRSDQPIKIAERVGKFIGTPPEQVLVRTSENAIHKLSPQQQVSGCYLSSHRKNMKALIPPSPPSDTAPCRARPT